jgi:hypothetical protein
MQMIEQISNMAELQKKYNVVAGRRPMVHDLVFVPALEAVFEVIYVSGMTVKIERGHKGSGLIVTLPVNNYKLIEPKRKQK